MKKFVLTEPFAVNSQKNWTVGMQYPRTYRSVCHFKECGYGREYRSCKIHVPDKTSIIDAIFNRNLTDLPTSEFVTASRILLESM